jgi:D-alanine transaminase
LKNIGYYNGKIGILEEMTLPLLDRAVYFGDGVYDVAMVKNGKTFAFADHVDRFVSSCKLARIELGLTREELENELLRLIDTAKTESDEFILYWQASRATASRSHTFPKGEYKANLMAYTTPLTVKNLFGKFHLHSVEDKRFQFCNVKTLNLLLNVLASQEAAENGCEEALFHRGDRVTEGSHTSINLLKDGRFITPPTDEYILPSTSRKHLIALCEELGIPVDVRVFTVDELKNADEIIVASATILCRPAESLDGQPIGGKAPDLYKTIADAYYARYLNETK